MEFNQVLSSGLLCHNKPPRQIYLFYPTVLSSCLSKYENKLGKMLLGICVVCSNSLRDALNHVLTVDKLLSSFLTDFAR